MQLKSPTKNPLFFQNRTSQFFFPSPPLSNLNRPRQDLRESRYLADPMPSAILVPPTSDERIQVSSGPYRTVRSASHTFSRQREGRDQAIDSFRTCLLSVSVIFFYYVNYILSLTRFIRSILPARLVLPQSRSFSD